MKNGKFIAVLALIIAAGAALLAALPYIKKKLSCSCCDDCDSLDDFDDFDDFEYVATDVNEECKEDEDIDCADEEIPSEETETKEESSSEDEEEIKNQD